MKKDKRNPKKSSKGVSRRGFLAGVGTAVVSSAVIGTGAQSAEAQILRVSRQEELQDIAITVNGVKYQVSVEPRWTLAEVLRDHLGLTGTKIGCNAGECGACTVLLDGKNVYSCSQLAVWVDGKSVTTVEGLAQSQSELHPLQQAFWEAHGLQCGFCTPGILMTLVPFLEENPDPTEAEIREAISGNLCRCTGYQHIVEAVKIAAEKMRD